MAAEFKDFVSRGNVVDLAVAVVIGGAFGKIVSSFVSDIIMPWVGLATGGVDFSALKVVLRPADPANKIAELALTYGAFFNTVLQFIIIAAAIFMVVKEINKKRTPAVDAPAGPTPSEALLTEIRDLLKSRA